MSSWPCPWLLVAAGPCCSMRCLSCCPACQVRVAVCMLLPVGLSAQTREAGHHSWAGRHQYSGGREKQPCSQQAAVAAAAVPAHGLLQRRTALLEIVKRTTAVGRTRQRPHAGSGKNKPTWRRRQARVTSPGVAAQGGLQYESTEVQPTCQKAAVAASLSTPSRLPFCMHCRKPLLL